MSDNIRYCFVVGTGRSGTHFLTSVLLENPKLADLRSGKENHKILKRVAKAAQLNAKQVPAANIAYYRFAKILVGNRVFLDQSHSNIHFVSDISNRLAGAYFIALWRDTNAIVSSMLLHEGVLNWYKTAASKPFPNIFLGNVSKTEFENMSLTEKCALRVVQHKNQIIKASKLHPKNFTVQNFKELVTNTDDAANKLFGKLGLPPVTQLSIRPNLDTLTKWQDHLDEESIITIKEVEKRYALYEHE